MDPTKFFESPKVDLLLGSAQGSVFGVSGSSSGISGCRVRTSQGPCFIANRVAGIHNSVILMFWGAALK